MVQVVLIKITDVQGGDLTAVQTTMLEPTARNHVEHVNNVIYIFRINRNTYTFYNKTSSTKLANSLNFLLPTIWNLQVSRLNTRIVILLFRRGAADTWVGEHKGSYYFRTTWLLTLFDLGGYFHPPSSFFPYLSKYKWYELHFLGLFLTFI